MFPPGTLQKNTGTVQFDNPSRHCAATRDRRASAIERQLSGTMAVSADYIRNELEELYHAPGPESGVRATTARTATVTCGPRTSPVPCSKSPTGLGQFRLVAVQPEQAPEPRLPVPRSRTRCRTPTATCRHPVYIDTISTQIGDDLNLEEGEARTTQDRPHVLSLGGSVEVPRPVGCIVSGGLQYQSGTPFTMTDSTLDPRSQRPVPGALPAGTYSGAADQFRSDHGGEQGRLPRRARARLLFLLNFARRLPLPAARLATRCRRTSISSTSPTAPTSTTPTRRSAATPRRS